MNPISAFFVENMIAVFFFYGLAFFVLGLALIFASRQTSEFRFAQAIRPLAAFGILHGSHEWVEMFQMIAVQTGHGPVPEWVNLLRLLLLVASFLMLLAFGIVLLSPETRWWLPKYVPLVLLVGLWLAATLIVRSIFTPAPGDLITLADVLARYIFGFPAAVVGTWALMGQQRTFRERDMPQFGRDLVWCAAALFLYGVIGQMFVHRSLLFPSTILNSQLFLDWFGIPVQLFRGVMAAWFTFFMVRALRAFELETRQKIEKANQSKLDAQAAALLAERHTSYEMERLNEELRQVVHELSLLLDLARLLAEPMDSLVRLQRVLDRVVHSIEYAGAALVMLTRQPGNVPYVAVSLGFETAPAPDSRYLLAQKIGEACILRNLAMCQHQNGDVIEFLLEDALQKQECRQHLSPTLVIGLPLVAQERAIGSIVLAAPPHNERRLTVGEFTLLVGIGQQVGLSIENARLYQDVYNREKLLAELLHQIVGAQEAERRRIARELHDATGQSLTAISLGLRGVETRLANGAPVSAEQIRELQSFGTNALGELRRIIADLRPSQLDDLGLVAALQWYISAFEQRRGICSRFVINGHPGRLPSEYETVLFRIVQEALTNVAKHAAASNVVVTLTTLPQEISLSIEDDGQGFDPGLVLNGGVEPVGWGLLGIRERALLLGGSYNVESAPGQGTVIRVNVPLLMELNHGQNTPVTG